MSGDLSSWIEAVLENPGLRGMGHAQSLEDRNLGLGWLYYGLARVLRPAIVVVIGSYRGFTPIMFGRALSDNGEGGRVCFIDPSFVDDFWKDAVAAVREHFTRFGTSNVEHFLMTTQQFTESDAYRSMASVGILFIDGYHTEEQARFDYEAFRSRLAPEGVVLLHDSIYVRPTRIYGPERVYTTSVRYFVDTLKQDPALQVFDLPFGSGVTLVRRVTPPAEHARNLSSQ